jgi:hypothetical protein
MISRNRVERMRTPTPRTVRIPSAERHEILRDAVSEMLAGGNCRVESTAPYTAVLVTGQRVNHVLHLLLSLLTFGLWLPVWLILIAFGGERRHVVAVDTCGNVTRFWVAT